jgi:glycosyltransferase involved in cell wall biosynthesis
MITAAFVTIFDPTDVRKGSGLAYYVAGGLRSHNVSLSHVALPENPFPSMLVGKITQALYRVLLHRNFDRLRNPVLARQWSLRLERALSDLETDIVFSTTSLPFAHARLHRPLAIWTDATFFGLRDFYPHMSRLPRWNVTAGDTLERAALERASLIIYSSDWAAATAADYYGIDSSKIHVVPFGANLDEPVPGQDVDRMIASRQLSSCRLLFVGVDSYRKGADIAIEVARILNDRGMRTELTIVGATDVGGREPFVRRTGYVTKDGTGPRMVDLFGSAHFALLPSRAECSSHFIAEANAFGVPVLTTNVGGIPTMLKEDVNGKMFSVDAHPGEYASFIVGLLHDRVRYEELARSSRREYETTLNWDAACGKVSGLLSTIV